MTIFLGVKPRRSFLAAGWAASMAAALGGRAMAAERGGSAVPRDFPFGRTDENNLSASDPSLSPRVRALIRIGEDGIAREDMAAVSAYFHPSYRFHGPGETELDREKLWSYFVACRAAFDDFTVTRQAVVSDGSDYLAARTRFAGRFAHPFTGMSGGSIEPNGKPFEYRLINMFRYGPDGRLVEEWAQYDVEAFLAQLRQPR
jgi:predicted ester cyclase